MNHQNYNFRLQHTQNNENIQIATQVQHGGLKYSGTHALLKHNNPNGNNPNNAYEFYNKTILNVCAPSFIRYLELRTATATNQQEFDNFVNNIKHQNERNKSQKRRQIF